MSFRIPRRGAAALAVLAVSAAGIVAAAPANAASNPPWEPDQNAKGTITFYDANGNVITSGSNTNGATGPFAAYAVGSAYPRSGDVKAALEFAQPDPANSNSINWYNEVITTFQTNPQSGASVPATVKTQSQTKPAVVNDQSDQNLEAFQSDAVQPTQAGYANVVQVRILSGNSNGQTNSQVYDTADLSIDPVNHTWTQIYPVVATGPVDTSTTLTATPNPAISGAAVSLTATETPAASGSVQFKDGANNIGTPVEVDANGKATTSTAALSTGTHSLTAVFTPADLNSFNPSTSAAVSEVVNAHTTSLSVAGSRTINYGTAVSITGALKDVSTNKALAGQAVVLQQRVTTSSTWTNLGTYHSSTTGALAGSVKPGANVYYRWYFAGNSTYKGVYSAAATINVNWVLTGAVTHASIKSGQTVVFWGSVSPIKTGTKVILQQLNGKTYGNTAYYALVKSQKLPNGKTGYGYVITVKLTSKKTYNFRATVAATSALHQGYSPAHLVKVS